jgi:hypothetical protein
MENKVEIKEDTQDDTSPPLPNEQQLEQKSDLNKINPPKKPLPDIKILKQDGGLTSNAKTKQLRKTLKTKLNIKNETIADLENQIQHEQKAIKDSVHAVTTDFVRYLKDKGVEVKKGDQISAAINNQTESLKKDLNTRRNDLSNKHKLYEDNQNKKIQQLKTKLSNLEAAEKKKTKAITKTTASSSSATSTATAKTTASSSSAKPIPPTKIATTTNKQSPKTANYNIKQKTKTPPVLMHLSLNNVSPASSSPATPPQEEKEEEEQKDEKEEKEVNSKKRIQAQNKITDTTRTESYYRCRHCCNGRIFEVFKR